MLRWALVFLVVAVVAAFFAFTGVAVTSAGIAKLLFYVFIAIFFVTLVFGLAAGRRPLT